MKRAAAVAAALCAAVLGGWVPAPAQEAPLATRTFTIAYRAVDDAVALVNPALSDRGSYSVQPRARAITVTDAPERLRAIQELLAGFDLPPRSIELVIQLMRAEEGAPDGAGGRLPARRMGLPPSVIQDLTKWGVITQIGNASVATAESGQGTVALGGAPEEFRVRFTMGAVSPAIGIVRMERFVLERLRRGPAAGGSDVPRYTTLMDLVLNLKDRETTVLGATSSQDSKQALFVAVTATAAKP
ncbi:MAG TPA: secretin N-terminal domain-containing protein [Candidatus Polarisedimenticolia bacterium]|nr:secretin N-terminal domain-containing protein [Candidatus Polarisedimenticolia bacterium]